MALFNGRITRQRRRGEGFLAAQLPVPTEARTSNRADRHVTLGVWPEDIELGPAEKQGWQRGDIYATDFRGLDRAIQVKLRRPFLPQGGAARRHLNQGDACWFDVPAGSAFVFDEESGARLNAGAGGRESDDAQQSDPLQDLDRASSSSASSC